MTRRFNSTAGSIGLLGTAFVLWVVSLARLNLSAIGSLGLISALPVTMYVGLAILTVSMVVAINRKERGSVLAAHLVLLILMIHGTPAVLYETLRYAWAWKHLGLIDYFANHRAIHPHAGDLAVYQNWPGFFTTTSTWLVGSGLKSWLGMAQWAPPAFELAFSCAVLALLKTIESDRRLVWLAVWFFAIGNWVGQDYFSPQAFAYFLYLAVLALMFRWLVRTRPMPLRLRGFVRDWPETEVPDHRELDRKETRAVVILILLLVTAIATSHPLTPLLMFAALCALALTRVLRVRSLPLMAAVPTFLWLVTGAWTYTAGNALPLLGQAGAVDANVGSTLAKAAHADSAQHLVSTLGRFEVVFLVALAGVGLVRRVRSGHWDLGAIVLAAVPISILIGGSYGGEAVFRVYLFSLPFLAYFAAACFYPRQNTESKAGTALLAVLCSGVILTTFMFAYYGKEAWAHFTQGEATAAAMVFDHAVPDSLLIQGTADYPTHFANYDKFTYVDFSSEPASSQAQVIANPVARLSTWLSDSRYSNSYLIITASQKAETDSLGELPKGSLDKIERALLASNKFQVLFHDRSAVLFTLAGSPAASNAGDGSQ